MSEPIKLTFPTQKKPKPIRRIEDVRPIVLFGIFTAFPTGDYICVEPKETNLLTDLNRKTFESSSCNWKLCTKLIVYNGKGMKYKYCCPEHKKRCQNFPEEKRTSI